VESTVRKFSAKKMAGFLTHATTFHFVSQVQCTVARTRALIGIKHWIIIICRKETKTNNYTSKIHEGEDKVRESETRKHASIIEKKESHS
jgi:hypothetical protein